MSENIEISHFKHVDLFSEDPDQTINVDPQCALPALHFFSDIFKFHLKDWLTSNTIKNTYQHIWYWYSSKGRGKRLEESKFEIGMNSFTVQRIFYWFYHHWKNQSILTLKQYVSNDFKNLTNTQYLKIRYHENMFSTLFEFRGLQNFAVISERSQFHFCLTCWPFWDSY